MSMYNNNSKDNLYNEIRDFLEEHRISELMEIVTDVIEYEKESEE